MKNFPHKALEIKGTAAAISLDQPGSWSTKNTLQN